MCGSWKMPWNAWCCLTRNSEITTEDLPDFLQASIPRPGETAQMALPENGISLEALEKDLILQALKKSAGNQTRAARYLHMSRRALAYRLEKYNAPAEATENPRAGRLETAIPLRTFVPE